MKKPILFLLAAIGTTSLAVAEPSGDRPDERHAYAVHDVNRPDPPKVVSQPGKPPSDAIVLFDGSQESVRKHWRDKNGKPSKWVVQDGTFTCTPGGGAAVTAEKFADCQLHVEWKTPTNDLYGLGNSGVVFLKGNYEIQILDSSNVTPSRSPWKHANYADGQAGAVYGQSPPLVQPCRKPGEWQTYDIVFHPPTWQGKRLVDPGSATVFFNGILVQDDVPFQGHTGWCRRYPHAKRSSDVISLQDHGHPVQFRNIWVRRIPSRFADTVNGGPGLKKGDVAALRHRLAAESLAFAQETQDPAERFIRLWESFCYEPDRNVAKQIKSVEDECLAALASGTGSFADANRRRAFERFVKMLESSNYIEQDTPIRKALEKRKAPPKPSVPNLKDI